MLSTVIKELKEFFSDKKIWIGILTVLIIIIIGTSYNRKMEESHLSEHLRLGVINNDDSSYSDLLLTYFNGSETFSSMVTVTIGDEKIVKEAFQQGKLDIYIEIPEGFARNMINIEHIPINVVLNIKDTTKALIFQNVLQSYEKYISAVEANAVGLYDIMENDGMDQKLIDDKNTEISLDLIFTALGKEKFFSYHSVATFPRTKISEYYIISILVMTLMYMGLYAGFRILREIRQGTLLRLKTTRMPVYQFLTAKILILTVILSVLSVLAISFIRGGSPTAGVILFGISAALFSVTLPILLSAFFDTTQRFILVGNLLMFYFAVIGGGIIPIMFLPQDIIQLSKLTPNYYMMEGIIRLNQGQPEHALRISMALLAGSAIFFAGTLLFFSRRRVSYEEG